MKYVALLSGGKDSCYNLLHCAQNGHELVAAASLRPEDGKEELDSYLYQTVGQDAIEFVARALDVPLYRNVIKGTAVDQGTEYGGRSIENSGGITGDETEDLYELLSTVKQHHPDVQGVSVGAILSNYQRVRVEHVCRRLNLTSLAYLWQREQGELLSEMIEAGMEAIIIKVAGIGLEPAHLGKTLAQMQPTFLKLNGLYGSHICGEGGEYESLTVDCPLFKKRINITETETVIHSDSDFATVAFLRVKSAILEDKPVDDTQAVLPPLLEDKYMDLGAIISKGPVTNKASVSSPSKSKPTLPSHIITTSLQAPWLVIGGIQASHRGEALPSIEQELRDCFKQAKARLSLQNMTLQDVAFITVLLSDITLFPAVNTVYNTFFGTSPPARACVALDLPTPTRIRMEVIACQDRELDVTSKRQGLHVQGLSYWAPANIGPYSQAIKVDERVYISGQIGLIPASMTFPSPQSLATETALCFQHADRIKRVLAANTGGDWEGHPQLILYWLANVADIPSVRAACQVYEQENSVPTLFLAVKSLPRSALVEKQVQLHTGRVLQIDDDDDEPSWVMRTPYTIRGNPLEGAQRISRQTSRLGSSIATIICLSIGTGGLTSEMVERARDHISTKALSIRVFHKSTWTLSLFGTVKEILVHCQGATTIIPCRSIATLEEENWDLAFCTIE